MVLGLFDDLVDLTLEEQVDTQADWWTLWVSSTGIEHIEDNLDVLIKIVGVLHTGVGFLGDNTGVIGFKNKKLRLLANY